MSGGSIDGCGAAGVFITVSARGYSGGVSNCTGCANSCGAGAFAASVPITGGSMVIAGVIVAGGSVVLLKGYPPLTRDVAA